MRTNQDIDLPLFQLEEDFLLFFCRPCATQVIHLHRKVGQPLPESVPMLRGQHGGRHQYGCLLPVGSRFKGSPDSNLCLAEPHVTTDQPVHGPFTLHIGFHITGSLHLVGRIFIHKRCFQLRLQITILRESKSFFLLALGIELDQVPGDIFDLLLGPLFHLLPRT